MACHARKRNELYRSPFPNAVIWYALRMNKKYFYDRRKLWIPACAGTTNERFNGQKVLFFAYNFITYDNIYYVIQQRMTFGEKLAGTLLVSEPFT